MSAITTIPGDEPGSSAQEHAADQKIPISVDTRKFVSGIARLYAYALRTMKTLAIVRTAPEQHYQPHQHRSQQ